MAEVFVEMGTVVHNGRVYLPRVCGAPADNVWHGWIEFVATDTGDVVRTARETTQPNRTDLAYWATCLTPTYCEGALNRALSPKPIVWEPPDMKSTFDEPAPPLTVRRAR